MSWGAPALTGSRLAKRHWQVVAVVGMAVLLSIAVTGLLGGFGSRTPDALRVFFLALLASAALSVPGLAFITWLDRREPESPWLYAFAIGWGMVGAAGLAFVLNGALGSALFASITGGDAPRAGAQESMLAFAVFVGPPVEEVTKGIALAALAFFLRGHLLTMRDGIVFGLLVGLGFTLIEAPFY